MDSGWTYRRVVICGGRGVSFAYYDVLTKVLQPSSIKEIATGGADGADALARRYAAETVISCTNYLPNWKLYGRGAGPKRNKLMIDEFKPDGVFAIYGGAGTASTIKYAREKGISVELLANETIWVDTMSYITSLQPVANQAVPLLFPPAEQPDEKSWRTVRITFKDGSSGHYVIVKKDGGNVGGIANLYVLGRHAQAMLVASMGPVTKNPKLIIYTAKAFGIDDVAKFPV